jgi:outer membrane protein
MKKSILILGLIFVFNFTFAQKFAFVDSEYILSKIPSYKAAQDKLNQLSKDWQKEIEAEYAELDKVTKDFQTEKILLTEEMRKNREQELNNKEKAVKELQKKYFGQEGMLFKKRQELMKPIQDEVYNAIKTLAETGNYSIIFDTAGGANIIYTDPKHDKSDEILEKLGYKK